MKPWQTLIKYGAIAFAVILIINIAVWSLSAFGFIFRLSSSGTSDEAKVYDFDTDSIDSLEIDIAAARFTLRADPCDKIIVKSNIKNLTAKENGNTLKVKEKQGLFTVTNTDAFVEIIYPVGSAFDKVDIDGGAGKLEISSLTVEEFDLDLGAGDTSLDSLTVTRNADIDGGAGSLAFTRSEITCLELDMGVGRLNFTGCLYGRNDIAFGVGEAFLVLRGEKEGYYFDVEKGIGEIEFYGTDDVNFERGNQENFVKIEGGIGNIVIKTEETAE